MKNQYDTKIRIERMRMLEINSVTSGEIAKGYFDALRTGKIFTTEERLERMKDYSNLVRQ